MNNSQELANLIKELAKEKNILVGEMLSDCNLSINTLSSMKSGGFFPRVEALAKIADYFNVSIDYLLGRTDVPTIETQASDSSITPREKAILLAYREKKDMQAAVERLLDVKIEEQQESLPAASKASEISQDVKSDRFVRLVEERTDHGRIKLKDAKIAAFGGYENPASTEDDLEDLEEIRQLFREIVDEQRKRRDK